MRTLEKKRQGVNWENYRQVVPVLTIVLICTLILIGIGICGMSEAAINTLGV